MESSAQVVVALHQHDVRAQPAGRNRRRRSGRSAADHEHVGLGKYGNFPRGFLVGQCWTRTWAPTIGAAEYFESLLFIDNVFHAVCHDPLQASYHRMRFLGFFVPGPEKTARPAIFSIQ